MKVGFIGLGNVGGKLAGSLLRNGTDITVCDLNADLVDSFTAQGAKGTMTPADLMQDDIVITCLPSPAASDAVMGDMLPNVIMEKSDGNVHNRRSRGQTAGGKSY